MRDLDKQPYTADEQRAAEFFFERGIGGGDDPIGALLAGYAYLVAERNDWIDYADKLEKVIELVAGASTDQLKRMHATQGLSLVRPGLG